MKTMTSKQRVLAILNGDKPDRSPYRISIGSKLNQTLASKYGDDYKDKYIQDDISHQSFWVRWPDVQYETTGDAYRHLAVFDTWDKFDSYVFPDAQDPQWYKDLDAAIKRDGQDKAIVSMFPSIFHTMDTFRHYDKFFMDVYDEPEKVSRLLEACTKTLENMVDNITKREIDLLIIGDDISTESAPMVSDDFLNKYVWKYNARLVEIAKKNSKKVFFHTDGVITDNIYNSLIDIGFDGIHPQQPTCNDIRDFQRKFSDKLLCYGWLDNTHTIPEQDIPAIEAHVKDIFSVLGERFMPSSSDIMDNAIPENVIALPQIIRDNCTFS